MGQGVQNVQLHGYMQNRIYANPDSTTRIVTERISLSAVGQLGKDATGYIEMYIHPWMTDAVVPNTTTGTGSVTAEEFRTYLESAYVDLPFAGGRMRIGKGRQLNFGMTPSYPNRKTTQYGILSETFTQDRITGFQYDQKVGSFDMGASVYTDQDLGTRGEGDFAGSEATKVVKHLVDKDIPGEISGKLAASAKVGWTMPCWQIHFSGATGKLNTNMLGAINSATAFNTPTNTNTDHNKYGVDAAWSKGALVAQGEWYTGTFSFLKITGYSALVGYQPKNSRRYYVRYAALNNNVAPTANAPTWPTEQLTFGIVQPIRQGVWAELNYEKNMERPGGGAKDVDNDLLFVEFFTGF